MSRTWIAYPAALLVAFAGCSADKVPPRSQTGSPKTTEGRRCNEEIPFEAAYLPAGFKPELTPGAAPGGRPADGKGQVIFHLRGNDGRAVEVRRPGTLFVELALGDDAPTIDVLGADTANFGPINPGGDEFIVFITYPPGADPEDECASFSLNEIGLSLAELKRVAEGLREVD